MTSPDRHTPEQQLEWVNNAWTRYQNALRNRQHGGVAADRLIAEVSDAIGRSQYEFQEKRDG